MQRRCVLLCGQEPGLGNTDKQYRSIRLRNTGAQTSFNLTFSTLPQKYMTILHMLYSLGWVLPCSSRHAHRRTIRSLLKTV